MSEIQETEREEHKLREAYGALSSRVKELLQAARERVDASQVKAAVERAGEELKKAGHHTETALARAAEVVRKEWGGITGKAREEAAPWTRRHRRCASWESTRKRRWPMPPRR